MDHGIGKLAGKDPLRELFHDVGHSTPASGLEEKVLARLNMQAEAAYAEPPLIPPRIGSLFAATIAGLVGIGLVLLPSSSTAPSGTPAWLEWLRSLHLPDVPSLGPVPAAIVGVLALWLVDRAIGARLRNPV